MFYWELYVDLINGTVDINDYINVLVFVGEQDARVLTLAEQIIAAMPDRIKVM